MGYRYPFTPFPEGWFFVCHASQLAHDALFTRLFLGQEIIAFRNEQGEARVFDAYCPHLGAHLGKTGHIEGGMVKCHFHGFRFDGQGHCVRTRCGKPSRRSELRAWHVQEVNGFVFAYHGAVRAIPVWRIPQLDGAGFSRAATRKLLIRSHPQEMSENSVDITHFAEVHGFEELEIIEPMHWEGPHLTSVYRVRRPSPLLDRLGMPVRVEFRLHKWGLGYSLAELSLPEYGVSGRQFVFPTPLDGEQVEVNLALSVRHTEGQRSGAGSKLAACIAREFLIRAFQREWRKDAIFWETKRYLARPALDRSDGPIGHFRRFCRQFYPALPQIGRGLREQLTGSPRPGSLDLAVTGAGHARVAQPAPSRPADSQIRVRREVS